MKKAHTEQKERMPGKSGAFEAPSGHYTIGALSRLTGVPHDTIRHYTELGLIVPAVSASGGYHTYDDYDIYTLYYIRSLRSIGLSLPEIARVFQEENDQEVCDSIERQIARTEAMLARKRQELDYMRGLAREIALYDAHPRKIHLMENVNFEYVNRRSLQKQQKVEDVLESWVSAIPFAQPYICASLEPQMSIEKAGFALFPIYGHYAGDARSRFHADRCLAMYAKTDDIFALLKESDAFFAAEAERRHAGLQPAIHCVVLKVQRRGGQRSFMVQLLRGILS